MAPGVAGSNPVIHPISLRPPQLSPAMQLAADSVSPSDFTRPTAARRASRVDRSRAACRFAGPSREPLVGLNSLPLTPGVQCSGSLEHAGRTGRCFRRGEAHLAPHLCSRSDAPRWSRRFDFRCRRYHASRASRTAMAASRGSHQGDALTTRGNTRSRSISHVGSRYCVDVHILRRLVATECRPAPRLLPVRARHGLRLGA